MLIAFYGEKRTGKDTSAEILHKLLPDFKKTSFAYIPKKILAQTFGISIEKFEELKNTDEIFRQYLINFAETMKEYFDQYVWAKLAISGENLIITDLRFKEEYDYIKKYNPIIIHIVDRNIKEENIDKLPFHFEIDNTEKDIKLLIKKIKKVYNDIKNFENLKKFSIKYWLC